MRRREFIWALAGAAAWPLAAPAQQPARHRKVGVLHPGQTGNVSLRLLAIREGLGDSGIELLVRLADGDPSRLSPLAADLVAHRVDAIIAAGPAAVQTARTATETIPIVAIDLESDPVAAGLVGSLARPGGNLTGVFLDLPEFSAKCLQLLTEAVSGISHIAVLWDPSTGRLQLEAIEVAARQLNINVKVFETRRLVDIADAFYGIDRSVIQGALILSSPVFGGNPQMIADLALRRKLPIMSLFPDVAREGGLLAYGPDIQGFYRQAGAIVRKVLLGANPAGIPAERPTRFQLVANQRTASLFGITLPATILASADEVIE